MSLVELEQEKLAAILEACHSYYRRTESSREDDRISPNAREFIASQLRPDMRVLDIGCGNGATLLEHCHRFASGLGVDHDLAHVDLAEEALRESECTNVEFRLLEFPGDAHELEPGAFDFAFTERGPIGCDSHGIQAALRILKDDALLFCEVIGNLHHQEVTETFGPGQTRQPHHETIRTLDQARAAMEQNGVSIRIAADIVRKRYYPSIYDWLQFQCRIWTWSGKPLPSPDDVRFRLFAERNTLQSGEIETTHHVVWV
ncbi:MAG: methyltransferase domain-containing protein, partial [Chloroflexi bacterium]|nr:methyltransferase domain-containing protein [Chloroflexota bacterium]